MGDGESKNLDFCALSIISRISLTPSRPDFCEDGQKDYLEKGYYAITGSNQSGFQKIGIF